MQEDNHKEIADTNTPRKRSMLKEDVMLERSEEISLAAEQ